MKQEQEQPKLSLFVPERFPHFVRDDNLSIIHFIESYYKSQESPFFSLDLVESLLDYYDLNSCYLRNLVKESILVEITESYIELKNTCGFPRSGFIKINDEIIYYGRVDGNRLYDYSRGTGTLLKVNDSFVFTTSEEGTHTFGDSVKNVAYDFAYSFYTKIKFEILESFPEALNENLNLSNILKNIKSFYLTKGTYTSDKLFFKILFNDLVLVTKLLDTGFGAVLKLVIHNSTIVRVDVLDGGEGYTDTLEVVTKGNGYGADFNVSVVDGVVTGVEVVNGGFGYDVNSYLEIAQKQFELGDIVEGENNNFARVVRASGRNISLYILKGRFSYGEIIKTDEVVDTIDYFDSLDALPKRITPYSNTLKLSDSKTIEYDYITLTPLDNEDTLESLKLGNTLTYRKCDDTYTFSYGNVNRVLDFYGKIKYNINVESNDFLFFNSTTKVLSVTEDDITVDNASGFSLSGGYFISGGYEYKFEKRNFNQLFDVTKVGHSQEISAGDFVQFIAYIHKGEKIYNLVYDENGKGYSIEPKFNGTKIFLSDGGFGEHLKYKIQESRVNTLDPYINYWRTNETFVVKDSAITENVFCDISAVFEGTNETYVAFTQIPNRNLDFSTLGAADQKELKRIQKRPRIVDKKSKNSKGVGVLLDGTQIQSFRGRELTYGKYTTMEIIDGGSNYPLVESAGTVTNPALAIKADSGNYIYLADLVKVYGSVDNISILNLTTDDLNGFTSKPSYTIENAAGDEGNGLVLDFKTEKTYNQFGRITNIKITAVIVVNGGQNYTKKPTIKIVGGGKIFPIAIPKDDISISGEVRFLNGTFNEDFTDDDLKTQYLLSSSEPKETLDAFTRVINPTIEYGSGAIIEVETIDGIVVSATVVDGGRNYIVTPTVKVLGVGFGALLRAVVVDGVITEVIVEAGGNGYSITPAVSVETPGEGFKTASEITKWTYNIPEIIATDDYGGFVFDKNSALHTQILDRNTLVSQEIIPGYLQVSYNHNATNNTYWVIDELYHSNIIGWSYDGVPIYSGYRTFKEPLNDNSANPDKPIFSSRASIGTFINSSGLIDYANIDEVRFNYDLADLTASPSLLLEAEAINLARDGENLSEWEISPADSLVVTENQAVSPDGNTTADLLVHDTNTNAHILFRTFSGSIDTQYTASVFVKSAGVQYATIRLDNSGFSSAKITVIDLTSGAVTTSTGEATPIAEDYGNGWYRVSVTNTTDSDGGNYVVALSPSINFGGTDYAGDGISGIYAWGVQVEAGDTVTSYIPSGYDFISRASEATYIDSNGLIATAAIDEARYNYNLNDLTDPPTLLLEDASTNLLESVDNWDSSSINVTLNAEVSPDGTANALEIIADDQEGSHYINGLVLDEPYTNGDTYTYSIFVKGDEGYKIRLAVYYSPGFRYADFDLLLNDIYVQGNTPYSYTDYGNGWYRVSITYQIADDTDNRMLCRVILRNSDGLVVYTGDNTTGGLYVFGGQCEKGDIPTSYIYTDTTAATREADVRVASTSTTRAEDITIMNSAPLDSSYRLKLSVDTFRPNIADYPFGYFVEDFEYVNGLGDLDEYNGRFCVTPEFPEGRYCYFATDTFPYFVGLTHKYTIDPYNIKSNSNVNYLPENLLRVHYNDERYPFYKNNNGSSYIEISQVSGGQIDTVYVENGGFNYTMSDKVIVDNTGTSGSGFSCRISKIRGVFILFSDYNAIDKRLTVSTSASHELLDKDEIFIKPEALNNTILPETTVTITSGMDDFSILNCLNYLFVLDSSFVDSGFQYYKIVFSRDPDILDTLYIPNYIFGDKQIQINTIDLPESFYILVVDSTDVIVESVRCFKEEFGLYGTHEIKYETNSSFSFLIPDNSVAFSGLFEPSYYSVVNTSGNYNAPIEEVSIVSPGDGYKLSPKLSVRSRTGNGASLNCSGVDVGRVLGFDIIKNTNFALGYTHDYYETSNYYSGKVKGNFELYDVELITPFFLEGDSPIVIIKNTATIIDVNFLTDGDYYYGIELVDTIKPLEAEYDLSIFYRAETEFDGETFSFGTIELPQTPVTDIALNNLLFFRNGVLQDETEYFLLNGEITFDPGDAPKQEERIFGIKTNNATYKKLTFAFSDNVTSFHLELFEGDGLDLSAETGDKFLVFKEGILQSKTKWTWDVTNRYIIFNEPVDPDFVEPYQSFQVIYLPESYEFFTTADNSIEITDNGNYTFAGVGGYDLNNILLSYNGVPQAKTIDFIRTSDDLLGGNFVDSLELVNPNPDEGETFAYVFGGDTSYVELVSTAEFNSIDIKGYYRRMPLPLDKALYTEDGTKVLFTNIGDNGDSVFFKENEGLDLSDGEENLYFYDGSLYGKLYATKGSRLYTNLDSKQDKTIIQKSSKISDKNDRLTSKYYNPFTLDIGFYKDPKDWRNTYKNVSKPAGIKAYDRMLFETFSSLDKSIRSNTSLKILPDEGIGQYVTVTDSGIALPDSNYCTFDCSGLMTWDGGNYIYSEAPPITYSIVGDNAVFSDSVGDILTVPSEEVLNPEIVVQYQCVDKPGC